MQIQTPVLSRSSCSTHLNSPSKRLTEAGEAAKTPSATDVLATGTVYAIGADANSSGGALVTVLVPRAQSQALTIAASAGQVSLIRVGS